MRKIKLFSATDCASVGYSFILDFSVILRDLKNIYTFYSFSQSV